MKQAIAITALTVACAVSLATATVARGPFDSRALAQAGQGQQSKPAAATQAPKPPLGIGRAAAADEVRAIDIDAMPDGRGLPPGRGTVAEGEAVYKARCQSCHGDKGQGKPFDRLVGRQETGPRTIGNYWPYATTIYDYTFRSMPFNQPGTLTPNEVYAVTAYLLHLNEIIPQDAVMDASTLPKVVMPARDKFVPDNRTGGKVVK